MPGYVRSDTRGRHQCRPAAVSMLGAARLDGHLSQVGGLVFLVRYTSRAAAAREALLAAGAAPRPVRYRTDWTGQRTRSNPLGMPVMTVEEVR